MKKKLNYLNFVLVFFITVPLLTISCGDKDNDNNTPSSAATISAVSSGSGKPGDVLTLTGSGFGTDRSKVNVRFNSTNATNIVSLADTKIEVEAPEGFSDETVNIRVFVSNRTSNAVEFYYEDTAPPVISSMTATCFYNSVVVITGEHFSANKDDNIVKFGTIEATVMEASKTSLTVSTPNLGAATTVNVTVTKLDMVSNARSIAVDVDQNKIATYAWTTHQVKEGIVYKTGTMTLFAGATRRIHILDVTLDDQNILGIAHSTTGRYTTTLSNENGGVVGINAGYFGGSDPKDPYIRIDGETKQVGHAPANQIFTNSALLIHNNVATVRKFTENHTNLNQVAAAIPVAQAQNIIVSGPMLVTNGVVEQQNMNSTHNSSSRARTSLGVTADGKRVFMAVVDEAGGSTGVQTPQMGKIMQALGAVNAMNFDGGGSSTMFVKDHGTNGLVNTPSTAPQRAIRNVIYVK